MPEDNRVSDRDQFKQPRQLTPAEIEALGQDSIATSLAMKRLLKDQASANT